MTDYLVSWLINIDAESPLEAAKEARKIQTDPDSTATLFGVTDRETKVDILVDLLEEEK